MTKKIEPEFDIHIWKQPGNEHDDTLYTVSVGKRGLCIEMPLAQAMACIGTYCEDR